MVSTAAPTIHGAAALRRSSSARYARASGSSGGPPVDGRAREAEAVHHLEEELGVRDAERELARLLLEDVLRERAPHVGGRPLAEHAREQHREVADVHLVLVAEVDEELRAREAGAREVRPGPVILAIHHREQALAEVVGVRHPRGHT